MSWQPIETAPKDGTRILVTDGKWVEIVEWYVLPPFANMPKTGQEGWISHIDSSSGFNYEQWFYDPKGWQPLPDPSVPEQARNETD